MGKKADELMMELVPTRNLLRAIGDILGVPVEQPVMQENAVAYLYAFERAIAIARIRRTRPAPTESDIAFQSVVDAEIAHAGAASTTAAVHHSTALATQPDIAQEVTEEDMTRANLGGIARELGLDEEQSDGDLVVAILEEIRRIKGAGGDVEVPKGDSLGEAVAFGHRQNNELRDRVARADLLIQRIANSLQVTIDKDSDGAEILQAVQRMEVTKVELRRRIVSLRALTRLPEATHSRLDATTSAATTAAADELEAQFVRLLSPAELAAWRARAGGRPDIAIPEHGPHPFQYRHDDLRTLAAAIRLSLDSLVTPGVGSMGMAEEARRSDLGHLFTEISASSEASAAFQNGMEMVLAILARERASALKE